MACAKLMISMLLCVATVYAVNLGGTCVDNAECDTENTHCMSLYEGCTEGRCLCNHDYYASGANCRLVLTIGDTCTNDNTGDDDCEAGTMGSTCENAACACPENRQNVETINNVRYCYGSLYGGDCTQHSDCLTRTLSGTYGICHDTEDTCTCAENAVRDGETCRLGTNGEACPDNGLECNQGAGLVCNAEHMCACPAGEKWHQEICVDDGATTVGEGEVCDQNYNTVEGAFCDSGLACVRCPEDANTVDTTCKQLAGGASGVTATITSVLGAATLVTLKMIL